MKKLFIAMAMTAIAISASAATVNWKSNALKQPKDTTGAIGSSNTTTAKSNGYLFTIDAATYTSLLASDYATTAANIWSAYGKTKDVGGVQKIDAGAMQTAASVYNGTVSLGAITLSQSVADSAGNVYAAVIYTFSDDTLGDYYIANVGTYNVEGSATYSVSGLGTTFNNGVTSTAIGSWTAVPEPTSGLLMLLGLAGLALKRKRA